MLMTGYLQKSEGFSFTNIHNIPCTHASEGHVLSGIEDEAQIFYCRETEGRVDL
jgi:hypothetical protein